MTASEKIRLMIVDDHAIMREGLKRILIGASDIQIVSEASNATELFRRLRRHKISAILLDLSMPGRTGLDILLQLRKEKPLIPVIVLGHPPEDETATRSFKAGAMGYLTKSSPSSELLAAIRKVVKRGRYVTKEIEHLLPEDLLAFTQKPLHESLSEREQEVLGLMATGSSLSVIATHLKLSVKTISTYRARILEKLHVENNAAVIRYAIDHGLEAKKFKD